MGRRRAIDEKYRAGNGYQSRYRDWSRKDSCGLCGRQLDVFHDAVQCGKAYQDAIDKELLAKKEGRKP